MAANGTVLALSLWRGGRRGPTTDRLRTSVAGTALLPLSREVNSGSRLLSLSCTFSLSSPPLTIPDQEIFVEGELLVEQSLNQGTHHRQSCRLNKKFLLDCITCPNQVLSLPKVTKLILALEIAFHKEFSWAFSCISPRH